jgi:hypothetical protein
MGVFEIIVLGWVVNVIVMVFISLYIIIKSIFSNPTKTVEEITEPQILITDINTLKQKLKDKELSGAVQKDYSFLIPFAEIVMFFKFLRSLFGHGVLYMLYVELMEKHEILEKRLNDNT